MAEPEFQDLIIVKRRLNTEPEMPKGGVWKIAFADFMTAMMCFFLVMWLINASNEDTRQAVASYFNPVRLAELNKKGLDNPHSPTENQAEDGEPTTGEGTPGSPKPTGPSADISREAPFKDPYRILSGTAGDEGPADGASGIRGSEGIEDSGSAAGTFRDPFDPEFLVGTMEEDPIGTEAEAANPPGSQQSALLAGVRGSNTLDVTESGRLPLSTPPIEEPLVQPGGTVPISSAPGAMAPSSVQLPSAYGHMRDQANAELQAELSQAVEEESGSDRSPGVAVEQTSEGVVISLTDDADFGMFDIGSADPQPQLVRIMERIATILKARSGFITIRGHTDARPFRTAAYDNWRLSTDRAQMAYYMLVRGGLDESRMEAIEGYADRKLKVPADPEAAENRRIEILLREASL